MAKIKPVSIVESISGRICTQDGTYFQTNTSSGNVYAVKLCNPYQGEATEKQTAQRTKFAAMSKAANTWLNANKPTDDNKKGTALYQQAEKLKKQFKMSNVREVLYHYMDATTYTISLPSTSSESAEDSQM